MTIASCWCIDYTCKSITHIDGNLNWDTGTGTVPCAGDYIMVTGSCKNIVMRTLVLFTGTSGTDAVSCVVTLGTAGKIGCGDVLAGLDQVDFDGVICGAACGQGFKVGDTVTGTTSTRTGVIRAIQYNDCMAGGGAAGDGTLWGVFTAGAWTNDEPLQVGGVTKALADGVGVDDNWAAQTGPSLLVNPGSCNTAEILNFDCCGTQVFTPNDSRIACSCLACPAEEAIVQKHLGASDGSVGSLITRCVNPAWINNDNIWLRHVVFFDTLVAGQVFSVGDVILGATSCATARVLRVVCDGDCTGKIITAGINNMCAALCEGAFSLCELITVGGTTIATVEAETFVLDSFTDINGAPRLIQRADQGGIYQDTTGINTLRSFNALYTYLQDTFDELAQLDDQVPMSAQVKDGQYTLINCWVMPDLSMRWLENGSIKTNDNNCIFTNYQSLGSIQDITDKVFFNDASCPTPQPNLYFEQDCCVLRQDWLEGNINVLIKTKTKLDTRYITPAVATLGQNISCGTVTLFGREFLNTYDHFETTTIGGTAPTPLATADDLNNNTGTQSVCFCTGGACAYTAGEEITAASGARAIVATSACGATGLLTYALKTPCCDFVNCEQILGAVSAKCANTTMCTQANLVAGYSDDVRLSFSQSSFTGGTVMCGPFQTGEPVSQAGSGACGIFVAVNACNDTIVLELVSCGPFNMCGVITDTVGCATYTPTATASTSTFCADLGDGTGDHTYNAAVAGNASGAGCVRTIQNVYEWSKFVTRSESVFSLGNLSTTGTDTEGRIYINLVSTYPEVKSAPFGTFAGGSMFGAQGLFINKCDLPAACRQLLQLTDTSGVLVCPPNLQSIAVTGLIACDSVAVYRANMCCTSCICCMEWDVGAIGGGNNQMCDSTVLVGSNVRTIPLCVCVPNTGVLRIQDPSEAATTGVFLRFTYTSVCRATNIFTLGATIGSVTCATDLRLDDDVFVVFVEEDASGATSCNCVQYNCCDFPLIVRVREKGILPFETTGAFSSTGFSTGAIRTTDTIVDLP